ncbi:MAG: S-methyl-5-thioribose-1-phosphate isomerase [Trueperaceae bacterium]|nr:S-methyl-5-thioribose-1-phosphate isomerase [Trueperaceae bacterium]
MPDRVQAVDFQAGKLVLLDQTLLPSEKTFLHLDDVADVWEAIKLLRVRGAPAIGGAAAYGLYLGVRGVPDDAGMPAFMAKLREVRDYLASSRPTAVNLFWALDRLVGVAEAATGDDVAALKARLLDEAHAIKAEDEAMCRAIGEHALTLFDGVDAVLTHCNAGSLATMGIGTALAPVYLAAEQGRTIHVFSDETRPLLQGARITTWELDQAGLPVTLITDGMAATVMRRGKVQAVIVGTDRVAANGDVANKIGTYGVAILAHEHGIPFYVAAPSSTIDFATPDGDAIEIEERDPDEVRRLGGRQTAPADIGVFNPAFDVTPARYVTAIVTEKGVVTAPYPENLRKVVLGG